jgi:hypothetical protein
MSTHMYKIGTFLEHFRLWWFNTFLRLSTKYQLSPCPQHFTLGLVQKSVSFCADTHNFSAIPPQPFLCSAPLNLKIFHIAQSYISPISFRLNISFKVPLPFSEPALCIFHWLHTCTHDLVKSCLLLSSL